MTEQAGAQPDIAEVTVRAVDQIGETAAAHLEANATAIERKAKRTADNLRQLAATIREQCKVASGHVEAFGEVANDVIDTTKELSARIAKPKPNGSDDGRPIPRFLAEGPVVADAPSLGRGE